MQEAQEEALQAALNIFNTEAVGGGTARKKYERQLHATVKKHFEVRTNFLWCGFFCMKDSFAWILINFNSADGQEVVYSKSSV